MRDYRVIQGDNRAKAPLASSTNVIADHSIQKNVVSMIDGK
jgi:hypothetical protein